MKLFARFWDGIIYWLNLVTLSTFSDDGFGQRPLLANRPSATDGIAIPVLENVPSTVNEPPGPIFVPPGSGNDNFTCDYSIMSGFRACSTPEDRTCWLTDDAGTTFDINTDYESVWPQGVVRQYTLDIHDGWVNADGINFTDAKLFNYSYPGPWLQACWGDRVEVTVNNYLKYNGTSIHWHGIRQWFTMHMDGVNGITQCPIAPKDYFVYNWTATQYGSSWYHSHFSLQYADGLAGPLTLHGPTSYPFDEAADLPTLLSDWYHNSAFEAQYTGALDKTLLLNGTGDVTRFGYKNTIDIPAPYTLIFEKQTALRPKRYLLRLINVSFDTTFIFSIDNHNLTVISADFVPIRNYTTSSVLVGIGQRYNVVVEANPVNAPSNMTDFWIRAEIADCFFQNHSTEYPKGYDQAGILRYDSLSTAKPESQAWTDIAHKCSDEDYSKIHPVVPWNIGPPANGPKGEEEDINSAAGPWPMAYFALNPSSSTNVTPFRIDYSNPIFLQLNNTGNWSNAWVVIPENYFENDWIYLVISGDVEHPIHLHGHDFAILSWTPGMTFNASTVQLNVMNPPRRDVVLLPDSGFVVIAFKADNPGSWLIHCHIAAHASAGLAAQILERREDANAFWPWGHSAALKEAQRVCGNWNDWYSNCTNWWPGDGSDCPANCKLSDPTYCFQDDSGI